MTPEQFFILTWHSWLAVIFDGLFFGMVAGVIKNMGGPKGGDIDE